MIENWLQGLSQEENLQNNNVKIFTHLKDDGIIDLENYQVALIGKGLMQTKEIRQALSRFHNHFDKLNIIDLGDLRKYEATYNIQLIRELINAGIICIFLEGDFNWYSEILKGVVIEKDSTKNICISNTLHFSEFGVQFDYLAFQRHLIDQEHFNSLHNYSIDSMSLGKVRAEGKLLEPCLRNTRHVFFDLSSLRKSDVPGSFHSLPSGLTCEEGCQIMKYVGLSNKIQTVLFNNQMEADERSSEVIAEMIWYFIEGVNDRPMDDPAIVKNHKIYVVENDGLNESFTFLKNEDSGRWWLKNEDQNTFIPCSMEEYDAFAKNEVTDRLLKHLTKL